jgi:type IV pilus assembly protein PilE
MKNHLLGFTLIELMICLTIMMILISISYPIYSDHLTRIKRSHAELALQQMAIRLQEFYSTAETYEGVTPNILHLDQLITDHSYQLVINEAHENNFLISAEPLGSQLQSDRCGTLSLDDEGTRSISGKSTVEECWR